MCVRGQGYHYSRVAIILYPFGYFELFEYTHTAWSMANDKDDNNKMEFFG